MSIKNTPRTGPRLEHFLGQSKMNFEKYFFSCLGSAHIGKTIQKGCEIESKVLEFEHQAA